MTYETNYLAHHGILGMKWGVRRFQRKDGSLTPAGERRLKKAQKTVSELSSNRTRKDMTAEEKEARKKKILASGSAKDIMAIRGELTTDELKEANERLKVLNDIASKAPKEKTTEEKLASIANKAKSVGSLIETGVNATSKLKELADKFDKEKQAKEATQKAQDRAIELKKRQLEFEKLAAEIEGTKARTRISNATAESNEWKNRQTAKEWRNNQSENERKISSYAAKAAADFFRDNKIWETKATTTEGVKSASKTFVDLQQSLSDLLGQIDMDDVKKMFGG